tara:strand:+ start:328 stop:492 length:165 start_codon:yes stop_codon:yes gene_type:complete
MDLVALVLEMNNPGLLVVVLLVDPTILHKLLVDMVEVVMVLIKVTINHSKPTQY